MQKIFGFKRRRPEGGHCDKSGFTLIELLVVIAIIGILASIVLASLNSARKKSRDARRIADVKQLQLALELYFDAQSPQGYPNASGATALALLTTGCGGAACIPNIPKDPLGTDYNFIGCSTTYHIGAALEESTNPALASGRHANGGICTGDTINGTACGTTGGCTAGQSTSACVANATGGRYCYDLTP